MEFMPGQLLSANWDDDGSFRVVKVLAAGDGAVHVRVYRERFESRPADVDEAALTLGSVFEDEHFGVGHLPLSEEEFALWEPILIKTVGVDEEELDGYRMWLDDPDAGVFTPRPTLAGRLRRLLRRDR
jgi:hypothetical protein